MDLRSVSEATKRARHAPDADGFQKSTTDQNAFLGWWLVSNKSGKSVRPELNSESQVLSSAIPHRVTPVITFLCARKSSKKAR